MASQDRRRPRSGHLEGAAGEAIAAADVVASDIVDGFGLLLHPMRLIATLRS